MKCLIGDISLICVLFTLYFFSFQLNVLTKNREMCIDYYIQDVDVIKNCMEILTTVDNYIMTTTKFGMTIDELTDMFNNCVLLEANFKEKVIYNIPNTNNTRKWMKLFDTGPSGIKNNIFRCFISFFCCGLKHKK